jgi:pyruvate,orthophosphate dikinase
MEKSFGERFAMDSYRRFLNMYGEVVMGIPHHDFEAAMDGLKKTLGVKEDSELTGGDLRTLCKKYKQIYAANDKGIINFYLIDDCINIY